MRMSEPFTFWTRAASALRRAVRAPAWSRPALVTLSLVVAATGPSTPAAAQVDLFSFLRPPANIPQAPARRNNNNGWWPGSLFQPQQPARPQEQHSAPPTQQQSAPKRREPPAEPEGTVYSSADAASQGRRQPPTQFALILGDRMGAQLAQGLADATVPDRARLAIVAQTVDDSGYLTGATDWIAKIPAAVTAARPNVTVVVLGADDLKPIREGDAELEPLSERWVEVYSRRVDALLAAVRRQAGRVIVVGLAPVADAALSEQYARLNEVLRVRAARAGLPFVNVWDGFVDEDGQYLSTGPAVDGQRRRLRYNDGVRFTRAGGRKLAFFVQKDLNRLLEDSAQPSAASEPGQGAASLAGGPSAGREAGKDSGKDSASLIAVSGTGESAARALRDGVLPPPLHGRADDFSWPPPSEAAPPPALR